MHLMDAKQMALGEGQLNDLLLGYYQARGATANDVVGAEHQWLIAQGATPGHLNDMWFEFLTTQGFNGSLADMKIQFWLSTSLAFSVVFVPGVVFPADLVSGQKMQTTLATNRRVMVNGVSTQAGENIPTINEKGLFTCGVITNLIKYSENVDQWGDQIGGLGTIIKTTNAGADPEGNQTADRLQLSLNGGTTASDFTGITQTPTWLAGRNYTASVWLKSFDNSNYDVLIDFNGTNTQVVTVTPEWQRFHNTISPLDTAARPFQPIRLRGLYGSSNSADILIWGIQVTETTYSLPYVPTEATPVSTAENFSDADQGDKFPIQGGLLEALDGIADGVELIDFSTAPVARANTSITPIEGGWRISSVADGLFGVDWPISETGIGDYYEIAASWESNTGNEIYLGVNLEGGSTPIRQADASPLLVREKVDADSLFAVVQALSTAGDYVDIKMVSMKKISPAQGMIELDWTPEFAPSDIPDNSIIGGILSALNSSLSILHVRKIATSPYLQLYDGSGGPTLLLNWQANITYPIQIIYGPRPASAGDLKTLIRAKVDDVWTESGIVDFDGSFNPATHLSFAYDNIYPQNVDNLKIHKEPVWP